MDEAIYIETTHSLGETTPVTQTVFDQWGTPDFSDRIRKHLVLLYFTTAACQWIRTFQLIIVTDRWIDENVDVWRELPNRNSKKHPVAQESPDVVLTLLVSSESNYQIIPLPAESLSWLNTSGSQESLRILHNETYQLNPSTNRSDFTFECTGGYVILSPSELAGDYVHTHVSTVRVSPIRSPTIAPPLPTNAIHRISKAVLSNSDLHADDVTSHARLLTRYSLISKAWSKSGVYDLLWPYLIEKNHTLNLDDNQFRNLVLCIQRNPRIGEVLLTLPRLRSDQLEIKDEELESLYGILIQSASSLRNLDISSRQWDLIHNHISSLEYVNRMSLRPGRGTLGNDSDDEQTSKRVGFYDILRTINRWTHFKELFVKSWEVEPDAKLPETPPSYSLHKLILNGIQLHGLRTRYNSLPLPIIQHLLSHSSSSSPKLQTIEINGITNLSQVDFKTIFSLIKSTIVSISIDDCIISSSPESRQNPTGGEERAFDAVVSEMPFILKASFNINGSEGLSSSLGILRKKPSSQTHSPSSTLAGEFKSAWTASPTDTIQDLENAFKVTGWKKVILLVEWDRYTPAGWKMNEGFGGVKEIAKGRGIECLLLWR